ncbi:PIN domain-containing protein [Terribacillus sp. JSM ZJ617]|uniref:PIN domain-containing protein n=1 Tax=Terribacillus sp. JSM ZJ617 TaxID=3342119 RepID=UPI0035A8CD8B
MNFFLDSTVFQNGKDVFLNNKLSRKFFDICEQQDFSIYISEVVLQEIRRQYKEFMKMQLTNIKKGMGALNTVPRLSYINQSLPDIDRLTGAFDDYFEQLRSEGRIILVPYDNNILPELIDRSIHRIMPFTEKKQEFRDAVIWFSYAKLAEEEQLENCFLISGNTTDYLDKKGYIHKELEEKSSRFQLLKDMHAVLNSTFMSPFMEKHALLESLRQRSWEEESIYEFLCRDDSWNNLLNYFRDEYESEDNGEVTTIKVSDKRLKIRGTDYVSNEFIVSGSCFIFVNFTNKESEYLYVDFIATYNSTHEALLNLQVTSYMDGYEYLEGVHRISQDEY